MKTALASALGIGDLPRQCFLVVEGQNILGSFLSLEAALDFKVRAGRASAMIFPDDGSWDMMRFLGGSPPCPH
jgi:hypothetical protein